MPAGGPVCGSIRPPGSRSLTNRALVVAALADGTNAALWDKPERITAKVRSAIPAVEEMAAASSRRTTGCPIAWGG